VKEGVTEYQRSAEKEKTGDKKESRVGESEGWGRRK
jgi:hypothetical protein